MTQKMVLVVAGPALAHVTRVLSVAEVLREQGYGVTLATDQSSLPWVPIATQRGYQAELLPDTIDATTFAAGSLAAPRSVVQTAVAADIALLQRLSPALVLVDWRPSMRLAAAIVGIPVVSLVNAYVTRYYRGPLSAPVTHPITKWVGQRIADRLMPLLAPLFFRRWAQPYKQIAQTYGARGWDDLRDYALGDTTLYPDLPLLNPMAPNAGMFIGPLTQYQLSVDPLPELRDPVLYITIGSDVLGKRAVALVEAVGDWPGSVVITRAGSDEHWPEHWISVEYADPAQLCALHHVAWLFHGGNGTCYQLLQQWVAQSSHIAGAIILSFYAEHQWNAAKLKSLGVLQYTCPIGDLGTDIAVSHALVYLRAAVAPKPPRSLVSEIMQYHNAPQRAAQEVITWLQQH